MAIAGLIKMQRHNLNNEQWKYTKIGNFSKFNFNGKKSSTYNKKSINQKCQIKINNRNFHISNIKKSNLIISDLKSALENNFQNFDNFFNKIIQNHDNPFINLNEKNYTNGLFIHIKDNSTFSNPIIIKTNSNTINNNVMESDRFFIGIGKNVSATIYIEEEIFKRCNLNTVTELFVDKNSNINLIHFSDKPKVTQIHNFASLVNNNSSLNYIPIDISGRLIKKNFYCKLNQPNSSCYLESLNILNKNNYIDNFIKIKHSKKNTFSFTNHKNILKDRATGVFYAKAIIEKNSVNSEANQSNKNLMLSDKATIHSNPQLEIYNNDVKCSHGSTTGEIDKDILFYMQSRGIKPLDCKKIILKGFINEITNKIKNKNIKNIISKKINNWFSDVN